ncbi:CocE/NonD family hydrolase [Planosporangium mesophilum]|uniref:Xaa-Pro dipeptidyl-peptidase C-terminal domain-containing protein n=1 Tax=Planosporangium mesophilum TaxID=689768 RepID=A0A8J3WZ29_9ACTN|nr:CocE/NonD family hydrolase [Planosporangium mesophilum]NJC85844.1 CocE/NonD family hydrolase [Planosporangium mesophilum]GII21905.1 hypothetical protein Pme01_15020 [Planosporangium mesophilum]
MALRSVALAVLLAGTVTAPATLVAGAAPAGAVTPAPITGFRYVDITAADGVVLKANVVEPATPGRHPAIVFISSWGLNDGEYLAQASAFARRGYVVLSYTARGFYGSGGQIETAGPKDIADVRSAIDWLIANTTADPARIGSAGVSYGAGISLIAAAFEPRIKSVVSLSGWTDLVASLYGNETRRPQAVYLLKAAAQLTGRPSPELTQIMDSYFANEKIDRLIAWGKVRSAATYVDAINRNRPAILMANSYGDSLFPPNQLVDFFGRLSGPKRLELAPGDHAVAEATGLLGLPNHVWDSTARWFDRYLAGRPNGIDTEPPVVLRRLNSTAVEQYPDWARASAPARRWYLGGPSGLIPTGPLAPAAPGDWSQQIWTGYDTTADAGVVMLSNGLTALTGVQQTVALGTVSRRYGGVWLSDPFAAGGAIRGRPRLHLTITSLVPTGTLVAYLYDVDALGVGRLVTHEPITWLSAPSTLDLQMQATAYNVPAGHRLALVLDTKDPLYFDGNPAGMAIKVAGPSWFDVPLR